MARQERVLDDAFGPSQPSSGGYYTTVTDIPLREEDRWDELIEWMESQRLRFVEVFRTIESGRELRSAAKSPGASCRSKREAAPCLDEGAVTIPVSPSSQR